MGTCNGSSIKSGTRSSSPSKNSQFTTPVIRLARRALVDPEGFTIPAATTAVAELVDNMTVLGSLPITSRSIPLPVGGATESASGVAESRTPASTVVSECVIIRVGLPSAGATALLYLREVVEDVITEAEEDVITEAEAAAVSVHDAEPADNVAARLRREEKLQVCSLLVGLQVLV